MSSIYEVVVNEEVGDNPILISFPAGVPGSSEDIKITAMRNKSGKKRKHIVEGKLQNISYQGCDFGVHSASNDLCNYAVGIVNEHTKKMQVVPIHHPFVLSIANKDIQSDNNHVSQMTNFERKQSLTEAFGSKKKQRAMKAAASNTISIENISGANAIENAITAMGNPIQNSEESIILNAANHALENSRRQLLPEYDTEATDIKHAYPTRGMIPHPVMMSLKERYESMNTEWNISINGNRIEDAPLLLEKWEDNFKKENSSIFILDCLKHNVFRNINDAKNLCKNICHLMFWHYMLLACSSVMDKRKAIIKEDLLTFLHHPPIQVFRHITETFLIFQKSNGKNAFATSKLLMYVNECTLQSCICHILYLYTI
jgi:hypothetical protein